MGKILVCGGAGYIGSHINKMLNQQGYETVVFDNLVYGHKEAVKWGELVVGDLKDTAALDELFAAKAREEGMSNLKGHRLVGGIRASIYNAMPLDGVKTLIAFMDRFAKENG